jgi:hypothetical protein
MISKRGNVVASEFVLTTEATLAPASNACAIGIDSEVMPLAMGECRFRCRHHQLRQPSIGYFDGAWFVGFAVGAVDTQVCSTRIVDDDPRLPTRFRYEALLCRTLSIGKYMHRVTVA